MTLTQISSRGVEDALRWSLGASGTDHYTFTGPGLSGTVNDPTIYLTRGHTYIFENNNSANAHPFRIQSTAGASGTVYNTGVTNNGGAGGTEIKFTVAHDAPDVLYYQCTSHANMGGQFNVAGSVADGTITRQKFATGAADVVEDTTPQLGGNLTTNSNDILFADNDSAKFGANTDLEVYHDPTTNHSFVAETGGGSLVVKADDFYLQNAGANHTQILSDSDADVKLAHNGTYKFQTTADGAKVLGTGNLIIPSGDTSQRGSASTGSLRFNTQTSMLELYDGSAWAGVGKSIPQIASVSNQATDGTAGTSMVIKGVGFVSGATVHYVGGNNVDIAAGSVTFNSSTQITAVSPALTVANAPYAIKVTNPDGGLDIVGPEVEVTGGSGPSWTTAAGQLGGGNLVKNSSVSITVAATDADSQAITFSETTSVLTSNANTPAATMNLSLNSSTGVISGTTPNVSSDTTYSFTLRATDTAGNTADRNFSITVQALPSPSYWFRGTSQGGTGLASGLTWTNTGQNYNSSGGGNANADRLYNYGQGTSGTYAGFKFTSYFGPVTIPVGHDKAQVVVTQRANTVYCNGFKWAGSQPSGGSTGTTEFANEEGTCPNPATYTFDIPSGSQGQSRWFIMTGYGGQNTSWSMQVTLVKTYNVNNP
tara:strand:- start:10 stop:1968 length:1959 start_codon:yes stop_codon:yes gene_type:complete